MNENHKKHIEKKMPFCCIKKVLLIAVLAVPFMQFAISINAQTTEQRQTPTKRTERIMIDDVVQDSYVEIRKPEGGVLPRRQTEEVKFALNFIRKRIMESNKLLY